MPTKEIDKNVDVIAPSNPTPSATALAPIPPSPTPHAPFSPIATAVPRATPSIGPVPGTLPPLEVYLSVDKNPSSAGDSVIFSISTNLAKENQHYRYELNFGDGSKPFRTNSNSVPHIFKTAGNYTASVTVLNDGSQAHNELGIFVRGRTTPPWLYILGGLAVVVLAIAMAARPTFRPHWNRDEPQTPPENVAINYELRFHSKVSDGQDRFETDGASLILRKTKQ